MKDRKPARLNKPQTLLSRPSGHPGTLVFPRGEGGFYRTPQWFESRRSFHQRHGCPPPTAARGSADRLAPTARPPPPASARSATLAPWTTLGRDSGAQSPQRARRGQNGGAGAEVSANWLCHSIQYPASAVGASRYRAENGRWLT